MSCIIVKLHKGASEAGPAEVVQATVTEGAVNFIVALLLREQPDCAYRAWFDECTTKLQNGDLVRLTHVGVVKL